MAVAMKTECPVSRETFREKAPLVLPVSIAGKSFDGVKKEFSTGSLGWNVNSKVQIEIDGKMVTCQVGLNVTIVGSKEFLAPSLVA